MDFALVHGSYHGAWCWDLLQPELERLGHRVFAMDLPISDRTADFGAYATAVEDALPPDSVPLLVGHSMGGLVIPLVAARRPVQRMVFVAAFMPVPGKSANQQRSEEPIDGLFKPSTMEFTDLGDGLWMVGPTTATELMYDDAPPALASWAVGQLRPQCYRIFDEVSTLAAWPDVPSSSIVCRDDHAANPAWVRAAARDRLGIEALEIEGGHSPFVTRPVEFAELLNSLTSGRQV